MIYQRDEMAIDRLLDQIETVAGFSQLVLGALCLLTGIWLTRRAFGVLFGRHPERYERFLPYVAFRMVMPLGAQCFVAVSGLLWFHLFGERPHILQLLSALLFWFALIRVLTALIRQALPSGRFERHSEHVLAFLLWLAFATWLIGLDQAVLDWMDSVTFHIGKSRLDLTTILNALLWVSVILIVALWISKVIEAWVLKLDEVDLSLRLVMAKLVRTLMMVAAILIVLPMVGIDLTVLSVFGGAVGVGLGFGLQRIASNYISGFIILLDRSIRIGDRLMLDSKQVGYVTRITSRFVVLKGLDGSEALVPNDTLISSTVVNQSYTDKEIWTSVTLQIDYASDLEQVIPLLTEAARHPRVKADPGPRVFVTQFADNGIQLEVGFWVLDPENGFMSLKSDILLSLWRACKANGITIPYPQREVRLVTGKADTGEDPA